MEQPLCSSAMGVCLHLTVPLGAVAMQKTQVSFSSARLLVSATPCMVLDDSSDPGGHTFYQVVHYGLTHALPAFLQQLLQRLQSIIRPQPLAHLKLQEIPDMLNRIGSLAVSRQRRR